MYSLTGSRSHRSLRKRVIFRDLLKVARQVISLMERGMLFQVFDAATAKRFSAAEILVLGMISLHVSVAERRLRDGVYTWRVYIFGGCH